MITDEVIAKERDLKSLMNYDVASWTKNDGGAIIERRHRHVTRTMKSCDGDLNRHLSGDLEILFFYYK